MKKNIFLLLILLSLSFSTTVKITSNVNSDVTVSQGGNSKTVSLTGGQEKSVDVAWLSTGQNITVHAISKDTDYNDTTFETKVASDVEEWDSNKVYEDAGTEVSYNGKVWQNKWYANSGEEPGVADVWEEVSGTSGAIIEVVLPHKPLSMDTAFVPLKSNKDVTVKIKALSIISGNLPSDQTVTLTVNSVDTVKLPLRTDGSTPIHSDITAFTQRNVHFTDNGLAVSLEKDFVGGVLTVYAINGKIVAQKQLTSSVENSLSIMNGAKGIYLLSYRSKSGAIFNYKYMNSQDRLSVSTSFDATQYRTIRSEFVTPRATTAKYRLFVTGTDIDTTFDITVQPQMNELVNIYIPSANGDIDFDALLDSATYEELFKHRYGVDPNYAGSQPGGDFFTYPSFKEAVAAIANKTATIYRKEGLTWGEKVTVTDKTTGKSHTYVTSTDYESNSGTETSVTVDYGDFLQVGDLNTKKAELAAFLGNISHETTGGWDSAPDGPYAWGLFYKEEAGMNDDTQGMYVASSELYPAYGNKSYHGRGPIQISYNYNYGQFSDFIYFDKNILLKEPEKVSHDPVLSFESAIWFWMTPQGRKPSCHDIMANVWQPNADDIAAGRDKSKFGMTVNVINGGLECGSGDGDSRVLNRIGYYKRYSEIMNAPLEDYLDCGQMSSY